MLLSQLGRLCVSIANKLCRGAVVPNDHCLGAQEIMTGDSIIVDTLLAENAPASLDFCCHNAIARPDAMGTLWYRFVATDDSALVSMCSTSGPTEPDSILQIYEAGVESSPESACDTLRRIGCNDDSSHCSSDGASAGLCLDSLQVGRTYFLVVGAKTECGLGQYELGVDSPCTPTGRSCPPRVPRRGSTGAN